MHPPRTLLPQTSVDVEYRACTGGVQEDVLIQPECAGAEIARVGATVGRIRVEAKRRMAAQIDADAAHAAALVDLLTKPRPAALHRSIALLQSVLELRGDSVSVMVDLSAAYLLQGSQDLALEGVLQSLEWSDRALEARPRDPAALFNRALALDALAADVQARAAWHAYLGVDAESRWATEASRRLGALALLPPVAVPGPGSSARDLALFATLHPQEALTWGWEELLPAWGHAVVAGDTKTAAERLSSAAVLGDALARLGGDRSLLDQVRLITALVPDGQAVRMLAADLKRYGRAREASRTARLARADSLYSAISSGAEQTPLGLWRDVGRAASRLNLRDPEAAAHFLDRAAAGAAGPHYLSLEARVFWIRGTLLQRIGRPGEAPDAYAAAESLYARLGERANRGVMESMIYNAHHFAGNPSAGYPWLYHAALTLRPFGFTAGRHSVMGGLAQVAWSERLPHATRDLLEEDLAVTTALGVPAFIAEARTDRALLSARMGDSKGAMRELAEVVPLLAQCDPATRRFLEATTAYARGMALLPTTPRSAAREFERLLDYSGNGQELWRTRGLAGRARARLAQGDIRSASADLDQVLSAVEHARARNTGAWAREVDFEVSSVVLRLVSMQAQRGEPRSALLSLERGSAALASFPLPYSQIVPVVPPGRIVLRPLLVGDTLFLWTIRDSSVMLERTVAARADLGAIVRARTALRGNADVQAWAELARLYDLLIRPVEWRLKPGDEVAVVMDGELAGIPAAALLDRRTGEPLVAKHRVWRAPSVSAAAQLADTSPPPGSATFVAPNFNRALNPGLEDLPGARREVAEVSRGYRANVVAGAVAERSALQAALQRATIVHFAGHAVSDNLHPERSYLVLSSSLAAPDGHLSAAQMDTLDLSHLRLVVLSACSTLGDDSRGVGFTGISGAILSSGARGVMGSLWPVDDGVTLVLMVEFHRAYRRTGNAPQALREAQLHLLASGDPRQASPTAWAAFEYVGR